MPEAGRRSIAGYLGTADDGGGRRRGDAARRRAAGRRSGVAGGAAPGRRRMKSPAAGRAERDCLSRRRSTAWSRSTARSWPSSISSGSASGRSPRCSGCPRPLPGCRYLKAIKRLKGILPRDPRLAANVKGRPRRRPRPTRGSGRRMEEIAGDVGSGFGGEIGAGAAAGRGVPRTASARRGADVGGVHRPASRAGRPDPRGLPGDGDDGGHRLADDSLATGGGDRRGTRRRARAGDSRAGWATSGSSARWAGAGWAWSTRPSRSRSAGTSR